MEVPVTRAYLVLIKANTDSTPSSPPSLQLAAIDLLKPERVAQEREALQRHFKHKRDHVLKRLKDMDLEVEIPPDSTFYIWLNLEKLPDPINNGLVGRFRSDSCGCLLLII
jgi:aspartate/methionine/tyrosine aminotransferase